MTDAEKRKFVAELYRGARWRRKVSRMSEEQIFAIWMKEQQKQAQKQEEPDKSDEDEIPF